MGTRNKSHKKLYNLGYSVDEILQILILQTAVLISDKLTPDQKIEFIFRSPVFFERYEKETNTDISLETILKKNKLQEKEDYNNAPKKGRHIKK